MVHVAILVQSIHHLYLYIHSVCWFEEVWLYIYSVLAEKSPKIGSGNVVASLECSKIAGLHAVPVWNQFCVAHCLSKFGVGHCMSAWVVSVI